MPICAVVLQNSDSANDLERELQKTATPIKRCELVPPPTSEAESLTIQDTPEMESRRKITTIEIEKIPFLNPNHSRQKRQRFMALWLMPFGFLAGITFSQMTGLQTFSNIGLGAIGEPLIGGLLGMGSGLLGSYVATAGDPSGKDEDIRILRKRHEENNWLLILETPLGSEIPWQALQSANPIEVIRFNEL
ncbi:hypothetical protein [Prochlorococcus sp. MIT 1341]|uniref:hypothetical protein n=1 Tax=Prochlorococcus sp. MIT 1341 TaxID=3096221 RepID=UPI002A749132|nr:hypothetical protein [Prochlorococcus sp. MIT 1341]